MRPDSEAIFSRKERESSFSFLQKMALESGLIRTESGLSRLKLVSRERNRNRRNRPKLSDYLFSAEGAYSPLRPRSSCSSASPLLKLAPGPSEPLGVLLGRTRAPTFRKCESASSLGHLRDTGSSVALAGSSPLLDVGVPLPGCPRDGELLAKSRVGICHSRRARCAAVTPCADR